MSCCTTCGALTEAGAVGPQGAPGVDGTNGVDGADAYSITTENFTQPAIAATVSVTVDRTDWMAGGQNIYISGGGYYSISSITDGTHVVVTNLGATGNTSPTTVIASGKKFTPSGPENPEAAIAANTLKGNATAGVATPTAIAIGANQFLARSSAGNISVKTLSDFALTILDDTNAAAVRTTIAAAPSATTITGTKSITGGGDLSANRTLELDGDETSPGNNKIYGTDGSGAKGWQTLALAGGYNHVQVFETSGTFTTPATISGHILVYVTGAGGSGGGTSSSASQCGGGGESGSTGIGIIDSTSLGATETVTVGTAPGGTSSFGTFISAAGGANGKGGSSAATAATAAVSTGGDINIPGSSIGTSYPAQGTTQGMRGGASFWGSGPSCAASDGAYGTDGRAATIWGCGGSGAFAGTANAASRSGGDGYHGVVIIFWNET